MPDMKQSPFTPMPEQKGSSSMIIGGVIILIVIAAIAYYVMSMGGQPAPAVPTAPAQEQTQPQAAAPETDTATAALSQQGSSDDTASIEADLNSTDFSSLDESSKI